MRPTPCRPVPSRRFWQARLPPESFSPGRVRSEYQKSFRWKAASTTDVIGLLGFLTKKVYAPFFEKYYYGTEIPEVN